MSAGATPASALDRSGCAASRHATASARRHYGCVCPDAVAANRRYARYQYAGKAHLCPGIEHRVDATGSRRRIQALYAVGYLEGDLARRLGYTNRKRVIPFMHNTNSRGRVYQSTASKVSALYDELRDLPGPSAQQRARAPRFGWHRPDEWDTADIDDPDSTPAAGGNRPIRIVDTDPSDPWHGALCRSDRYDPELWWSGSVRATERAVRICQRCPVRRHCLRHALIAGEDFGVWGAISESKRRVVRAELRRTLGGRPPAGSPELDAVLDQHTGAGVSGA